MTKNIDDLIKKVISFSQQVYKENPIPLHRPIFEGNEKNFLSECIDTNFVSSAGKRVDEFEEKIASFTGSKYAVATVNGTSALHIALKLLGVKENTEVITQSLTFVATCNSISYLNAVPIFVDVDRDTMGMSPSALEFFLKENTTFRKGVLFNKKSDRKISACLPMHTYGYPCRIREIKKICKDWNIPLLEDCAESLGSFIDKKHSGNFGVAGALSFNGNKLITTGGGGMIITNNKKLASAAKHMTTTAKVPHPYNYIHNEIGYNYRLPNINAALGCAQIEKIEFFLSQKRILNNKWKKALEEFNLSFLEALENSTSNNWLNTIVLTSRKDRDKFLKLTNKKGVMTRPTWELMSDLPMYKNCPRDSLSNSRFLRDRVVNLPSSVPHKMLSSTSI
tara:strand:+ start:17289 stop:18470 length:1182 start_codon:yes stop_codon:yes gene_type:complete